MSVTFDGDKPKVIYEISMNNTTVSFTTELTASDIEMIFQWKQHRYDMEDISIAMDDIFTNGEMRRFMNNTDKNRMNFYHEAATIKREIMDKDNISWREASEQAIKRIKEQYL